MPQLCMDNTELVYVLRWRKPRRDTQRKTTGKLWHGYKQSTPVNTYLSLSCSTVGRPTHGPAPSGQWLRQAGRGRLRLILADTAPISATECGRVFRRTMIIMSQWLRYAFDVDLSWRTHPLLSQQCSFAPIRYLHNAPLLCMNRETEDTTKSRLTDMTARSEKRMIDTCLLSTCVVLHSSKCSAYEWRAFHLVASADHLQATVSDGV